MSFTLNEFYGYGEESHDHLPMGQKPLPSQRITVRTRLSNMRVINSIRNSIKRTFVDCEIFEEPGNLMTVTGYPPESDYGEDRILATVKKYDPRAQRV